MNENKNINKDNNAVFIPIDQKNFVGIGKVVFDFNKEWNIPNLHFMVDHTSSGNYEATLLEFGLVSWSETEQESIKNLIMQTHNYILTLMEKNNFDEFIRNVNDHVMDDYWRHYRKIEFTLARSGSDLSHNFDNQIVQAIKEMLSEEAKNIIREIAKDSAENLVSIFDKIFTLTPSTFTYKEIKEAA